MSTSRVTTVAGLAVFAAGTAVLILAKGLILSRDWLFAWLLLGLLAVSLGDLRRWARGLVVDWLPLMAVLLCYDLSRVVSDWVGTRPHTLPQLDADEALGGGTIPTLHLQDAAYHQGHPHAWDFLVWAIYMSHFFVTLTVLAVLWKVAYPRFRRYRLHVVALATAGFVTYVLFPAVPPWMASSRGYLPETHRVIAELWSFLGVRPANALFENHAEFYNDVAAIPSLHAAYPMLLALFLWPIAGRWGRTALASYVVAMGVTLVYTGEHYAVDVLIGWLYAIVLFTAIEAAMRRFEARRAARVAPHAPNREPAASPAPEPLQV